MRLTCPCHVFSAYKPNPSLCFPTPLPSPTLFPSSHPPPCPLTLTPHTHADTHTHPEREREREITKMVEEAIPSIWASVHGWLTPTVLFVLLNLVIGTIAVTSKGIRRDGGASGGDPSKLARSSSLLLERLRSFSFCRYSSGDIHLETGPPPPASGSEPLEALHAEPDPDIAAESDAPEADPAGEERHQISRSQSDAQPTAGEVPVKLASKMKKSASDNSAFSHFEAEEAEVVRRPETARARTGQRVAEAEEEGGEVDARAENFINRFRQQLKLQRLDSLLRYKEMLNRGAGS